MAVMTTNAGRTRSLSRCGTLSGSPFQNDAILMIIKRGSSSYIPHGETYLRLGDVLHVFGTATALEDTRKKVG